MDRPQGEQEPAAGDPALFGMTDLEDRLWAPGGGELLRAVLARLEDLGTRVDGAIAAGLPRSEFESAQVIRKALASARTFMLAGLHTSKP